MTLIPQAVIKAAENRKDYGGSLQMLCTYKRYEVYSYVYDEDVTIGMPELYLWNGKNVRVVGAEQAERLLTKLPIE